VSQKGLNVADLKLDPLYIIFEQHLYDFNDDTDSETAFIEKVVGDYIKFLVSCGAVIPRKLVGPVSEELKDQVQRMLRKKIYGCTNMQEFIAKERRNGRRSSKATRK
jgi:hypothetical protein